MLSTTDISHEPEGNRRDNHGCLGWRWRRTTSTLTGCHGLKQTIWLRTNHFGGDCGPQVALQALVDGVSWRWRRTVWERGITHYRIIATK